MPLLATSPEPRAPEPRSVEILDRIKTVFATKGFDGASMQQLAKAAGMSAGNFYRYFPSKDAIIEAIIRRDIDDVQREFTAIISSTTPRETFREMVRMRLETLDPEKGPIWAEIEASAARRPEIAALMSRMEAEIIGYIVAVFAHIAGVDVAQAQLRFTAHARLIVMLIQGLPMRSCGNPTGQPRSEDPELAALVLSVIERTLTEVAEPVLPPASAPMVDLDNGAVVPSESVN